MNYHDLHPASVADLRAEPRLLILDFRDQASYALGHLDDAEAVTDARLRELMKSRQRERPVLVYCYHGNTSRDLCQFIAGFGYTRVYNLVGGWQNWLLHLQAATAAPSAAVPSQALAAWLAEHGFPPNRLHARIDNGISPLMLAALKGERTLLEELLALGAEPNHVNDDDHHALWFACVHGDPEIVSLFITHGANVDNQNVNGATCAIYAASTGKLDVLRRLVEAGADLDKETTGGYTALDSASTLPVLKYLRGVAAAMA
jgi:rhodanese-related sulfurtransferase